MPKLVQIPDETIEGFDSLREESGFRTDIELLNECVRTYRMGMAGAKRGEIQVNLNRQTGHYHQMPSPGWEHARQVRDNLRIMAGPRVAEPEKLRA